MQHLIRLLNLIVFFGTTLNVLSQQGKPFNPTDLPYISKEDYESPFFENAKKLWLPDSITSTYDFAKDSALMYCKSQKEIKHLSKSDYLLLNYYVANDKQKTWDNLKKLSFYTDSLAVQVFANILLNDSDKDYKPMCIKNLGDVNYGFSKQALIKYAAFCDNIRNPEVLVKALVNNGEDSIAFVVVQKNFYTVHTSSQIALLNYLRILKRKDAIAFLNEIIQQHGNDYLFASTCMVAAQLGEGSVVLGYLKEQANNPDKFIRIITLKGLAYLGNKESIVIIKEKLNDNDLKVKQTAKEILKYLQPLNH